MLIDKIRASVKDVAISTDIIVGFPGETETDFNETLEVYEKAGFDFAFTFIYSKRTGTPAAKRPDQIPDELKNQRFAAVAGLAAGLIVLYVFGTLWFVFGYTGDGEMNFALAAMKCVVPFLIPDLVKMLLALWINRRIPRKERQA